MTLSKASPFIDFDTKAAIDQDLIVKEDDNEDLSEGESGDSLSENLESPMIGKEVKFEKTETNQFLDDVRS